MASVNVLAQIGLNPDEELTKLGAPPIWNFIKSDDDRKAVELITSQQVFHRSYIAPPGMPRGAAFDPAHRLRRHDERSRNSWPIAEKIGIDILPLGGGKIQDVIEAASSHGDAGDAPSVQRAQRAVDVGFPE